MLCASFQTYLLADAGTNVMAHLAVVQRARIEIFSDAKATTAPEAGWKRKELLFMGLSVS